MEDLEQRLTRLLPENYEGLTQQSGAECTAAVIEYVGGVSNVMGKPFDFVKQLSKVSDHIQSSSASLDHLLERVYLLNMMGVTMARQLKRADDHKQQVEAHLWAYAANAARRLFEKTGEIVWAERWYDGEKQSADITQETEPLHSAYAYGFAANAAKALFEATGDKRWAERWYEENKISADLTAKTEPLHTGYTLSFAANAAKALFEATGDKKWAERWYDGEKQSADMTRQVKPLHATHAFAFAADAAKAFFEATEEKKWAERWYEGYRASADLAREADPLHAAHASSFAGNAAKELFNVTGERRWAIKAVQMYQRFLAYFSQHPLEKMDMVIGRIQKDVNYLKRR